MSYKCYIVLIIVGVVIEYMACQQVGAWYADTLSPEHIRAAMLDTDRDPRIPHDPAASDPFAGLATLAEEEQVSILRDVIKHGNPRMAAASVGVLFSAHREHAIELLDVIGQRLPEMPDGSEASVLRYVSMHMDDAAWVSLAQDVTRRHIDNEIAYERDDRLLGAVDEAARILQKSNDQEDRQLIQEAVIAFPESPELWIALAQVNAVELQHQVLGLSMYGDAELPMELRTAIAVTLAPHVPDAMKRAKAWIEVTIDRFGAIDVERTMQDLVQLGPDAPDESEIQLYKTRHIGGRIIRMMGALPPETAKELVERAFGVENRSVRIIAAMIAAERLPEWLLETGLDQLDSETLDIICAYLASEHTQRAGVARGRAANPEAFDQIQEEIREFGISLTLMRRGIGPFVVY